MNKVELRRRTIGVNFSEDKNTEIAVWAPLVEKLECRLGQQNIALQKDEMGYWRAVTDHVQPGARYKFVINGTDEFPDPASLFQPEGVHGHSEAVALNGFKWSDIGWRNMPLEHYIIYELHTGTFSEEGTFAGIEKKLDYLKQLGITAIEIMPVAQFPGGRNWGYDGVFPFAVQNTYGGPRGLQRLVDACHQKGLAVILDVVYNHLGPEGNYLGAYGPYFTDKYKTPWGNALNFDDAWCDGVREYFIENALMWFRDFHVDALRLDAVHAIKDLGAVHLLREIKLHLEEYKRLSGKEHYLIVECDLNDPRYIDPLDQHGYGMDAQWIDEFHHALRVTAGGDRSGYYEDFTGISHLAKAYRDAYVYDGQFSSHRKKNFGAKTSNPGRQFVVFSQNHDQVGNRMLGERTSALQSFEMQKLLAAAVFVSPYLPMLFMGEEWSEPHPFLYFVSHTDKELADAVRKGRKAEFAAFHARGEAPDPVAEETFQESRLEWDLLTKEPHRTMLHYYQHLIGLRKLQPALRCTDRANLLVDCNSDWQTITLQRWNEGQEVLCLMNFSKKQQFLIPPSNVRDWQIMLDSAHPKWKGPASAAPTITGGTPGAGSVTLQPESILIYTNRLFT